jgi:hypothetical protein
MNNAQTSIDPPMAGKYQWLHVFIEPLPCGVVTHVEVSGKKGMHTGSKKT